METLKKKSIIYLAINKIFLLPALLIGVNITFFADIFFLVLFLYFIIPLMPIHFVAVLIILIISIRAAHREGEEMFIKKLILLSVVNVFLNILGWYLFFSYAMSIK